MHSLPAYITKIISVFEKNGYNAYAVGGCVRDILLGKKPDDYDITTSCPPEKTMELFEKTIPTGIKHGTVTVITENKSVEVTTFRKDGEYSDNRSPDSVSFVDALEADLSRRDFTINAMAYKGENIIDLFDGINDLKNKTIRAIGNPNERFCEDALRILRAFRFAAKLDFSIEENTYSAILKNSHLLENISAERIFSELSKTICSKNTNVLGNLVDSGCLTHLGLLEIESADKIALLPEKLSVRFPAFSLLCGVSAFELAKKLKCDNALKNHCKNIDTLSSIPLSNKKSVLKKAMSITDIQSVTDYLLIQNLCFGKDFTLSLIKEISVNNEPYKIEHLQIGGDDIIAMSFEGRRVGEVLKTLLEYVIEQPENNTKEKLKNKVTQIYKTP